MDAVHFHLLITHLPVFASVFGAALLAWGLFRDSRETRQAAYFLLVLAALGAMASNVSGEEAEHAVEDLPGVMESLIEEHEESVSIVLWMLIPSGLFSLLAFWSLWKRKKIEQKFAWIALSLSLLGFIATARTAWLGGQIRHSEIRSGAIQNAEHSEEESEKEPEH
jgi:drug/metabolite transporter (DMT)-like permease